MTLILEGKGLLKRYAADGVSVEALRGIDIEVAAGDFVAIMGRSGCGKTTLLNLLGGLDVPTAGEVLLEGTSLSRLSRSELAGVRGRRVGFVFQLFHLLPTLTLWENVALPALVAGMRRSHYADRVDELLDQVGLSDKRARFPSQLSGGEQQRVAIARALVMEPVVLLADEPTGNVDSRTGAGLLDLLREFNGRGQTIVLVTHDVKASSRARRVLFMRDGRLVDEVTIPPAEGETLLLSKLVRLEQA